MFKFFSSKKRHQKKMKDVVFSKAKNFESLLPFPPSNDIQEKLPESRRDFNRREPWASKELNNTPGNPSRNPLRKEPDRYQIDPIDVRAKLEKRYEPTRYRHKEQMEPPPYGNDFQKKPNNYVNQSNTSIERDLHHDVYSPHPHMGSVYERDLHGHFYVRSKNLQEESSREGRERDERPNNGRPIRGDLNATFGKRETRSREVAFRDFDPREAHLMERNLKRTTIGSFRGPRESVPRKTELSHLQTVRLYPSVGNMKFQDFMKKSDYYDESSFLENSNRGFPNVALHSDFEGRRALLGDLHSEAHFKTNEQVDGKNGPIRFFLCIFMLGILCSLGWSIYRYVVPSSFSSFVLVKAEQGPYKIQSPSSEIPTQQAVDQNKLIYDRMLNKKKVLNGQRETKEKVLPEPEGALVWASEKEELPYEQRNQVSSHYRQSNPRMQKNQKQQRLQVPIQHRKQNNQAPKYFNTAQHAKRKTQRLPQGRQESITEPENFGEDRYREDSYQRRNYQNPNYSNAQQKNYSPPASNIRQYSNDSDLERQANYFPSHSPYQEEAYYNRENRNQQDSFHNYPNSESQSISEYQDPEYSEKPEYQDYQEDYQR